MKVNEKEISCSVSEIESIIFDKVDKPTFLLINDVNYQNDDVCAIFIIQDKEIFIDYGGCEEDWNALNAISIGDSFHSTEFAGLTLMRIA